MKKVDPAGRSYRQETLNLYNKPKGARKFEE